MAISRLSILLGISMVFSCWGITMKGEVRAETPLGFSQGQTLVMSCSGSIEANDLTYTVVYGAEGGFSSIEFSKNGSTIAVAQLRFSGKNDNDHSVWRGVTSGASDVILIHLSEQAARPRDEISVGYNGQWSRGQCDGYYWENYGV